jgi:RNase adapter protein RapZ
MSKSKLVVITGRSGSGMSTALDALADNGFHCIDNQPIELLSPTVDLIESGRLANKRGVAMVMDIRDPKFIEQFSKMRNEISKRIRLEVIFLTSDDNSISTRYSTTRRRHPLLEDGETLLEAIERERVLLAPIEESADKVIDTTLLSPHQLARLVEAQFESDFPQRTLHVTITSFGFKYGHLKQADTFFDVRFINNPFFVKELKEKSGLDQEVRDFVFSHDDANEMFKKIEDMTRFLLPKYHSEGKHYFRIGIGCSGGRHRSVSFAETLGQKFLETPIPNVIATIIHRDLDD